MKTVRNSGYYEAYLRGVGGAGVGRDTRGRFLPGFCGNPRGRPRGSKNCPKADGIPCNAPIFFIRCDLDSTKDTFKQLIRAPKGEDQYIVLRGAKRLNREERFRLRDALYWRARRSAVPYTLHCRRLPGLVFFWAYEPCREIGETDVFKNWWDANAAQGFFPEVRDYQRRNRT